ncbi:MAG: hypothetical protein JWO38_8177 [Gemmataceae bacterium]|nr:hypothetical protein [Gemmataceae bacterium]
MEDTPLTARFPDLQPGRKPSSLGATNGFGTTLIGNRGHDPETDTYVATHWFTALFIPVIALGAYRVANAQGGGWYCLGKVPLSLAARGWNLFLLLALLGTIGGIAWHQHTKSPEYAAGRKLDEADEAAAAGQGGRAARLCREVMDTKTARADDASRKLVGLVEAPPGPPAEAAGVYAVAVDLHRENRCPVSDLLDRGQALAAGHAADDPAAALALLEVIAPLAPDPAAELALRRQLLEKLAAKAPDDPEIASRLAVVYEEQGERDRCEKLLAPFEGRLGTLDGAAILGRIYAGRGQHDKAHALLAPFVAARLPALREAEQGMTAEIKAAQERIIDTLKTGSAPGFDYARHKRSTEAQQDAMIGEYVGGQIKNDPGLRAARQKLMAQRAVVGAVLDLGLVQLQRGQAKTDPAARKAELEAAERTFLSVRGIAGENDEYRLSLGQVYYWLGRPADGKKLFDELLKARGKSTDVLLLVAGTLREVGDSTEARRMAEEAYNKEPDPGKKQRAARFRALLRVDTDDEILWLTRSNPDSPDIQASLAAARGQKAERDGKADEAVGHFRRAIDLYAGMPDGAATFNNSALAHFGLYHVTLDPEDLRKGLDKLDRAIALLPSDSILLFNGSTSVLSGVFRDVAGTEVDFRPLKSPPAWDVLPYLYHTPAERAAIADRFARHPGTVKARAYAEKLLVLAPKRDDSYSLLAALSEQTRDLDGLKGVVARAEKAEIDLGDDRREYQDFLTGKSDKKKAEEARAAVTRATAALAAARPVGGRTFAVAVGRYVRAKTAGWVYGEPVDADELVKLAEEVHAATPSTGTETTLVTALAFRAHATLTREDAGYAVLADRTKRSFSTTLVYYVLAADGLHRARAAGNPDVKQLAALALESLRRDPAAASTGEWVLIRAVSPERAGAFAEKVKANEWRRVRYQLARVTAPFRPATALDEYWDLLLAGKGTEAKKVIADLAAKDIPVP